MKKEMLINVLQPEECRIAILENGVLEELYVERTSAESYVGNIYKGRVVNIEPSIQAAFIDFGVGRNGFLHVSDVEPTYYRHLTESRGENGRDRDRDRDRDRGRGRGEGQRRPERRPAARHEMHVVIPAGTPAEPREEEEPVPVAEAAEPEIVEAELAEEEVSTVEPQVIEEETATATVEAPSEPQAVVEEAGPPSAEQPAAQTAIEEKPARKKPRAAGTRKTRSRDTAEAEAEPAPRKRTRKKSEETSEEAAPPAETVEEAPAESVEKPRKPRTGSRRKKKAEVEAGSGDEGEPPAPRVMDSAERRTEEDNPSGSVSDASEPPASEDDFLFFPRPRPQPRPEPVVTAPPAEPPPVEVVSELASAPAPEPVPEVHYRSERRHRDHDRGRGGRHRGRRSVEQELEEDLREAEVGEPASTAREFLPPREPGPRAPVEPADIGEEEEGLEDFEEGPRWTEDIEEGGRGDAGRDRGRDRGRGRRRRPAGRDSGRDRGERAKPPIQEIFKRGQEVLVQVIKEGLGSKGPTLSTYISIAGRYLVLMPGLNRIGVSRKIADEEQRRRLRDIFSELKAPKGLGFIIRTAGVDRTRKELQRDLAYLSRLWQVVVRRIRQRKGPGELYQESDMIIRTIRDVFTSDVDTIWIDEPSAYARAKEFMDVVMPRYADRLKLFEGKEPLFHRFGIEQEIHRIQQKKVPLPQGGSLVIEQTEALVAIDVNSGNFRAENNPEETAYQMNLLAAREIARQLRLRDLGGVIVNDFIDMREERHRRAVEKALRDAVRRDRARTKVLRMSAFGIIEMTRQRIRPSLKRSVYHDCPHCLGHGQVKTPESMSIEVMRLLQLACTREGVSRIEVRVTAEVAQYLLNRKRKEICQFEQDQNIRIQIEGVPHAPAELLEFLCLDKNGNEVKLNPEENRHARVRR